MAYRIKVFGLSERDARDQKASTFIGRLCLAYENGERAMSLSTPQYHAALDYYRDHNAYQRAMGGPVDYTESRDLWSLSGEPDPEAREAGYERFCTDAKRRWAERQRIIQQHILETGQTAGRDFLNHAVLQDKACFLYVAAGRELLNRFIEQYNLGQKKAA